MLPNLSLTLLYTHTKNLCLVYPQNFGLSVDSKNEPCTEGLISVNLPKKYELNFGDM